MAIEIMRAAPAKLNLTLQIIGRRADGYHLLDSLVGFTEYGDTLTAAPAESLGLTLDGPFGMVLADDGAENLVLRAARLLAAEAGLAPRARLRLTKRLPVASGIGGGSSDAAAALLALSDLWAIAPTPDDLARIALTLGADVPVCLGGLTARLQGIGEVITASPSVPPAALLLVNPGIALPTPKVFAAREGEFSAGAGPQGVLSASPGDARALAAALLPYPNDLTEAAIRVQPIIATVLAVLAEAPGAVLARMSGSGATCFALFETADQAEAAAARIKTAHPAWWAVATRLRP